MGDKIPWSEGRWTHPPESAHASGADLRVTSTAQSDAWRITSYGFVHDSENALLARFAPGAAMEVSFSAQLSRQFDQAGIFIRSSLSRWIKAGIEYVDGVPQLGAVVTEGMSDWSSNPVPDWNGERVTIRASWSADAITVRARMNDEAFRFVRLAPLDRKHAVSAGPFLASPTRSGLEVSFHSWTREVADSSLHGES